MKFTCAECAHEFELTDEEVAGTGGSTKCPSCGEETSLGSVPAGATQPWHPGEAAQAAEDKPHGMFDDAEAAAEAEEAAEASEAASEPKERSVLFDIGDIQSMGKRTRPEGHSGPPEASGLLDIRMLAEVIHQHEEEEKAAGHVKFVADKKPSAPAALPTHAVAPPPVVEERGGKNTLMIVLVVFLVLVVAATVLIYLLNKKKSGSGAAGSGKAAAAVTEEMDRPAPGKDAMPAARKAAMKAPMKAAMKAAMKAPMKAAMKAPPAPVKLWKMGKKHRKQGIATVEGRFQSCAKDRKGRFTFKLRVEGKTGKVSKIKVYGRKQRKSETGKCLLELLHEAQFPRFRKKRQTFKWRVKIQ